MDRVSALSFVADGKQPSDVSKARNADGIAVRSGKREAELMLKKLDSDLAVHYPFTFYNSGKWPTPWQWMTAK